MTIDWATALAIPLILLSGTTNANELYVNQIGDNFTLTVTQSGGDHYANIGVFGDDHTIAVEQRDDGLHSFTVDLTNAGGSYDINSLQYGSTTQTYSLTGFCTNTTGCVVSVTQY